MWLHVPACSPSAAASEGSISGFDWPAERAPFVTSSGTPTPRPCSWRGWRTRGWIARLSGLTLSDSTLEHGVASWISSLRDTPASPSASPGSEAAPTTNGTSGPTSPASSETASPASSSLRTSQGTFPWDSTPCSLTLPPWGSMRHGVVYERATPGLRTHGDGSSCWPTATSMDANSSGAWAYSTESGRHAGTTLTDAAVRLWATPTARGWKDGFDPAEAEPTNGLLGRQAPRTRMAGNDGSQPVALNPRFVEALMGFAGEWTDCDASVTPSSRSKPRSPSECSQSVPP